MTTLLRRLEWVLKNRRDVVVNAKQWSERAGLARQHVTTLMARLRKNPSAGSDGQTLAKLARAARVSIAWLVDGVGNPDDLAAEIVDVDDRYPNRAKAAAAAQALGDIGVEAIRRVRERRYQLDEDMPPSWWLGQMQAEQQLLHRGGLPGRPIDDDP